MKHRVVSHRSLVLSSIHIAALVVGQVGLAQRTAPVGSDPGLRRIEGIRATDAVTLTLEGSVLDPGGAPAEGAVVVSSAGGQTVTDASGGFRLDIRVTLDATSLQVTAVGRGGGDFLASRQVPLRATPGPIRIGPLQLDRVTTCPPSWLPTFGEQPGTDDRIYAMTTFDDGSGEALFVAGDFTSVGNVAANRVAKWDGSSWAPLGSGMDFYNDSVYALTVFNDGGGEALYAAGHFDFAGGMEANHIAKWDGSSWAALGSGMEYLNEVNARVNALTVFDDGNGAALYAGGVFVAAGGVPANDIAKWDGSNWSAVGSGVGSSSVDGVLALTTFDDGAGMALYAGGSFGIAGGMVSVGIAKWDGSSWVSLGSGIGGNVLALAAFDDGGGIALYAGGGAFPDGVAKWDGSAWVPLGSETDREVYCLTVFDDGNGEALYAGGDFSTVDGVPASYVAKWDGSSWSAVGGGVEPGFFTTGSVRALAEFNSNGQATLCAGGRFWVAGGVAVTSIANWNGASWSGFSTGMDNNVNVLAVFDDGSGPALYAGGRFYSVGAILAFRIAKWDGSNWSPLGIWTDGDVESLTVFDDGGGEALYAGGGFDSVGGTVASRIAKWNGSSWAPLGIGISGTVFALTVFDDGSGSALYAGGQFAFAGGASAKHIAKWDGSSWAPLGGGIGGSQGVFALAVFDDGDGAALYAGGHFFTAGSVAASRIAKWDGSSWEALGSGVDGRLYALAVYDDGSGPALYAGGHFAVARWDDSSWTAVGSGVDGVVRALSVFDEGGGATLYAGGTFTTAGGGAANRMAKLDGSDWVPLGSGMNGDVYSLAVFNDGDGEALYAGGGFLGALDSGDSFIAKWGCDTPLCSQFCSALPNATGIAADLTCSGHPRSSLVLTSSPVPNTTGQFFFGPMMLAGTSFGDGLLCVGGMTQRLLPFISAGMGMQLPNTATFAVSYTAPYSSGLTGTQYFQHWFRSGLATGSGFNTSNGLAVSF